MVIFVQFEDRDDSADINASNWVLAKLFVLSESNDAISLDAHHSKPFIQGGELFTCGPILKALLVLNIIDLPFYSCSSSGLDLAPRIQLFFQAKHLKI